MEQVIQNLSTEKKTHHRIWYLVVDRQNMARSDRNTADPISEEMIFTLLLKS